MNAHSSSAESGSSRYSAEEWQTRVDLAACYRLADRFGFSDIVWNHITARVPGTEEHFLINSFGRRHDEISASNLVKLDMEGKVIDGPEDVNVTGFIIHSAVHAARPDVQCIMHSHSEGGLAVSALEDGLLPVIQDAMMFYKRIAYHEYEGLSTDPEERERLADNLGDLGAMIMRNHGLLTVGESVGEAFIRMYYLERACKAQIQAMSTGGALKLPSAEVCEKAAAQCSLFPPGKYEWPALLRLLDRDSPGFRD